MQNPLDFKGVFEPFGPLPNFSLSAFTALRSSPSYYLCGFGHLFFLKLLLVRACLYVCSVYKYRARVYGSVVYCLIHVLCARISLPVAPPETFCRMRSLPLQSAVSYPAGYIPETSGMIVCHLPVLVFDAKMGSRISVGSVPSVWALPGLFRLCRCRGNSMDSDAHTAIRSPWLFSIFRIIWSDGTNPSASTNSILFLSIFPRSNILHHPVYFTTLHQKSPAFAGPFSTVCAVQSFCTAFVL